MRGRRPLASLWRPTKRPPFTGRRAPGTWARGEIPQVLGTRSVLSKRLLQYQHMEVFVSRPTVINPTEYRRALGHYPTGVAVVAAQEE